MKVFTCKDFRGVWPVGAAAVVVAEDRKSAKLRLRAVLRSQGLPQNGFTVEEVDLSEPKVIVLVDGDY